MDDVIIGNTYKSIYLETALFCQIHVLFDDTRGIGIQERTMMEDFKRFPSELNEMEYEEHLPHRPANIELAFYRAVAAGSINYVQENCSRGAFEDQTGVGQLSDDPVRNLKYHFVVTTAMIARFCMDEGMPMEESYRLSDSYIKRMDRCTSLADIVLLHDQMALDYTTRMHNRRKIAASTRHVMEAIDYIYVHIHERITVEDLSEAIYVSPSYLSRVFKKEIGMSVSEYIRQSKLDWAKKLLRFTDNELADIANQLAFSSQSHFIQQFRAYTGMTPKAFRKMYASRNYDINTEDKPME